MARDIDERLKSLKSRRSGIDRLDRVATASVLDVLEKSIATEAWEKRQSSNKHTRYALGAMQPVADDYTRISLETAKRVGKHLEDKLPHGVILKCQGSVPLDVHIRGVSDVDLLAIHEAQLTFDGNGCRAGTYTVISAPTAIGLLAQLRMDSEKILKGAYPAAKVDCSGGKAIKLSGGSLPRPVDVVPSQWHDNCAYQESRMDHDRGVRIFDKNVPETLVNLPFLHMKLIGDEDDLLDGALKKAIRLAKNVKNDAEDDKTAAKLTSFDVAALTYHCDFGNLSRARYYELAVLAELQRFYDWCYHHEASAKQLMTPDGTRTVINTNEKMSAVKTISVELDKLAQRVAEEQLAKDSISDWGTVSKTLNEALNL